MTSKIRSTRRKKLPIEVKTNTEISELSFRNLFKAVYKSEIWIHIKYIFERFFYLLQTLLIGSVIQYFWNLAMVKWFAGEYQVNLFEAAILWICVY